MCQRNKNSEYNQSSNYLSAPLWQQVQKWLREKHNLHANVVTEGFGSIIRFSYTISGLNQYNSYNPVMGVGNPNRCESYEEALETALVEALNLL